MPRIGYKRRRAPSTNVMRPYKRPRYTRPSPASLGIETKFHDEYVLAAAIPSSAPTVLDPVTTECLNSIPQGDSPTDRDGRAYLLKSVHVRGTVQNISTEACNVRILLVHDTQTNAAQMDGSDVLEPKTANIGIYAFRDLEYSTRFRILHDEIINVTPQPWQGASSTQTDIPTKFFSINKKLNVKVTTVGSSATVAGISDHSLHIVAVAQNNFCELTYYSRVRFQG